MDVWVRDQLRARSSRVAVCLSLALVLVAGRTPAWGAKWTQGCPEVEFDLHPVARGSLGTVYAASRYFEHVGHELTFYLVDKDVRRSGGFSTEPSAYTLEVVFTPLGKGEPIPLPPVPLTASSSGTLTIVVPDSRPILGRLVVGPARFIVRQGDVVVFETIRPTIIPPMNDVRALTSEGGQVEVLATMDAREDLWIPLSFGGFGPGPTLPECPVDLTPVTRFAVDLSFKRGAQTIPHAGVKTLSSTRLFFGDYLLWGTNMYGSRVKAKLDVSSLAGRGVAVCALNDALELVLMLPLRKGAGNVSSDIIPLVRDGSPFVVKLEEISADPKVGPRLEDLSRDSLGTPCR